MFSNLFSSLIPNMLASYRGGNVLWHVLAAGLTAALVLTGADWLFYEYTRIEAFIPLIYLAGIGGFFVPVLTPVALLMYGEYARSTRLTLTAIAAGQAVVIAWCISSFYKALTGRIEPEFISTLLAEDRSRVWNFGFLEYGIYWGWPSSHTAVAFALVVSIAVCLRGNYAAMFVGGSYALFVGLGAAIGFHWLSDVLAGAIVGTLVGLAVGRHFLQRIAST